MTPTKWRIIKLDTHNAFINMAIDEAISESVAKNESLPTIRFYKWKPSAVSIGYFQSMTDEISVEKCKKLGIHMVRRRTGGGAVYHDSEGELTYSVIAPEKIMPRGITESYQLICGWIIDSLLKIGIKSEFRPINDIIVGEKKISGNAQTRRNGVLLQHGTILFDVDVEKMFSVLNVSKEKIASKLIQSAKQRVTSVKNESKASLDELYRAMISGFTEGKDFEFGEMSTQEKIKAAMLAETIYKTKEWNFMR